MWGTAITAAARRSALRRSAVPAAARRSALGRSAVPAAAGGSALWGTAITAAAATRGKTAATGGAVTALSLNAFVCADHRLRISRYLRAIDVA